jgi:tRNA 2-thiouridine synthesizing protein A
MQHIILDVRKLLCPLPVIRVQQKIKELNPGSILEILATDRGVLYDIPAWCRIHGYTVTKTTELKHEIRIEIAI